MFSERVRETSEHQDAYTARRDIPPLWVARVGWLDRLVDWWHGWKAGE